MDGDVVIVTKKTLALKILDRANSNGKLSQKEWFKCP